jgi:aminoglycoside phosphotransferase (APT) family kinase protein
MPSSVAGAALPGLELGRLRAHLEAERPGFTRGPLTGELIQGGRSNLTYVVTDGTRRWVVRRPPLGHVLATAHDMAREYRVLTALADTSVPVPRTELLCQDDDVIGAPFYVMEYVAGTVYRSAEMTQRLSKAERDDVSMRLIDVLVDLHGINPETVGLADFGRPEGFLQRQVRRWSKQLAASRHREIDGIDELIDGLSQRIPVPPTASIVHGDYRLDNVIVDGDQRVSAVLDWEMATLGDPLADLGVFVVYWDGFGDIEPDPIVKGVGSKHGFPSAETLLERYANGSGTDLSTLDWYVAFGFFKIAVILEGIHYRFTTGQTVGEGFEQVGAVVAPLVAKGLRALEEA